jgi:cbb3-type cytochrome oxidase subunit 3
MRHLSNVNELVLYACASCAVAFISRLLPALFFPILLLRLAIFFYCVYVVANLEKNRELALIIGSALFIGLIGGYWDLIEVYLRYDLGVITGTISITLCFLAALLGLYIHLRTNGKVSQK